MLEEERKKLLPDLYLSNTSERINFIIVYNTKECLKSGYYKAVRQAFQNNLSELDIKFELANSLGNKDTAFLKISTPDVLLIEYANIHSIDLAFNSKTPTFQQPSRYLRCFHTELTFPVLDSDLYKRAGESIGNKIPKTLTQAERYLLTYLILTDISYGPEREERGIERLIKTGAATTFFPLHEGETEWTEQGPLIDRQILHKYWVKKNFKVPPLAMIEKYYGPEMGFFIAFLDLTYKMMVIATILGLFFFILSFLTEGDVLKQIRDYICNTEKELCAMCDPKRCKRRKLSSYCNAILLIKLHFDNIEMLILAICITLWGTIFLELWKRKEALLCLQWNLSNLSIDVETRPDYHEQARLLVESPITKRLEATMSLHEVTMRVVMSVAGVFILISLVIGVQLLVIMAKAEIITVVQQHSNSFLTWQKVDLIGSMLASGASVAVIVLIDLFYDNISRILTNWENPRTQSQYDNSYLLKCFFFAFANNYVMLLYIAFGKGKFYTYPGDELLYDVKGAYMVDSCDVGGCNSELAIQIILILGVKHIFVRSIAKYLMRYIFVFFTKKRYRLPADAPQWEKDFILMPCDRYEISLAYTETVLRYGYVMFFTATCPLTPLLTLIVTIVQKKLYEFQYSKLYRRPIPRKVNGIKIWLFIMTSMTWIGVTVNVVLATLTQNYLMMNYYFTKRSENVTEYFEKMRLAAFDMKDYKEAYYGNVEDDQYCYFFGSRYPPNHERKYQSTKTYLDYLRIAMGLSVIYLHILFLVSKLISFLIPDISSDVRDYVAQQQANDLNDLRLYREHQRRSRVNSSPTSSILEKLKQAVRKAK